MCAYLCVVCVCVCVCSIYGQQCQASSAPGLLMWTFWEVAPRTAVTHTRWRGCNCCTHTDTHAFNREGMKGQQLQLRDGRMGEESWTGNKRPESPNQAIYTRICHCGHGCPATLFTHRILACVILELFWLLSCWIFSELLILELGKDYKSWAVVAECVGDESEEQRGGGGGSRFEPQFRQNMEGHLVVGEGATTTTDHCQGALEQDTEPTNAHIGPCNELATCLRLHVHLTCDLKVVKEKKTRIYWITKGALWLCQVHACT